MDRRASQTKNPASNRKTASAGNLIVLSAPSGAGKTTLCRAIRNRFPEMRYSISHTTRSPRPGEAEGVDYFFISEEEFQTDIQKGIWAEWARVHDNYYGTSMAFLNKTLASGADVLLDIDIQGARQILEKYPDAVSIFIMPPSLEILLQRLQGRGTESGTVIEKRMMNARKEIAQSRFYQYIVVNDDLEDAKQELFSIIQRHTTG